MDKSSDQPNKKKKERVRRKSKSKQSKPKSDEKKMTKLAKFKEYTKMMKEAWSFASEEASDNEIGMTVPDGLKKYTIEDRKVILQQPMRQRPKTLGISYDGP